MKQFLFPSAAGLVLALILASYAARRQIRSTPAYRANRSRDSGWGAGRGGVELSRPAVAGLVVSDERVQAIRPELYTLQGENVPRCATRITCITMA
jgi:hypothetical protein